MQRLRVRDFIGIGIAALLSCISGVANGFVNDDILLIQENARVQELALAEILTKPYWPPPFPQDLYRPATTLLHAIECAVGGCDPVVFRLASYAAYVAIAVGVGLLLGRLFDRRAALAGSLLFAVHPVHVEAVALAVGQAELLVALIAVYSTLWYVHLRGSASALSRSQWVILGLLFAIAVLSKETGYVVPALWLVAEVTLHERLMKRRARSLAMGFAFLGAAGIILVAVRVAVLGNLTGTFVAPALLGLGARDRVFTMLSVVPEWSRLFFWPVHLRADYSPAEFVAQRSFGLASFKGALWLIFLGVLVWRSRARTPAAFGLGWVVIAILPVSNVIFPSGILLAERTLFLPTVGIAVLLGLAADRLFTSTPLAMRKAGYGFVAALAIGGLWRSAERHRVWRNEGILRLRTAADAPRSFRAQRDYGHTMYVIGYADEGRLAYERALRFAPQSERWNVRDDFAAQLRQSGHPEAAAAQLKQSLLEKPEQPKTRADFVAVLLYLGRYREAEAQLDSAMIPDRAAAQVLRAATDSAIANSLPPSSINIGVRGEGWR